ncbi:hypothetical protein AAV94_13905 [Lampropedia cohaerens]|uniref:UvrD-like helicase ATP-binding domain-containing protein n=1 Tax=Lampropedia cohaerens TaxID=1610491 RepID=A0A0U1PWG0_9BURK|nr:DNA/RNA helicase domain-containing protein [Lampropedia cohaerens]KKW66830.1 hypothetical protein AAV94_13905 [Lampropedia cohaerens]
MAIFIPEKIGAKGAKAIHIKRTLSALDDAHVVRTPFARQQWLPDFFIQHAKNGWLAIAVSDTPFSAIPQAQLFSHDQPTPFEELLQRFHAFSCATAQPGETPLKKLILMWKCNTQQVQHISTRYAHKYGVTFISRDAFHQGGAQLISRILAPVSTRQTAMLLGSCFPEAEIAPASTTHRLFRRDNSASLGRYFLDYDQEWAAKLDLQQPEDVTDAGKDFSLRLVNGVAGSGKTLIALSRALLLAELHPDQQVLVLIHNAPIVADVQARLLQTRSALPANVTITTFFAWARQQWTRLYQRQPDCASAQEAERLIARLRQQWPALTQPDAILLEELDFINENLIAELPAYLQASRTGRGFALREKERTAVWALYEAVTRTLARPPRRAMLWSAMPRDICMAADHAAMQRADHVLIDEAQFFAPAWFQAVRHGMRQQGSLFLCADPNQGFMKSRLSWKSVGLEVAGRTKKLRRSYRTTQAILTAANQILQQHSTSDSDDFLQPDLTGMEPGQPPVLVQCDSVQDCIEKLINEMQAAHRDHALSLADMLVVYGSRVSAYALYEQLGRHFGGETVWWFNKSETRRQPPAGYGRAYLRMANVDTATGLEAGVVFLVGVEELVSAAALADAQARDHSAAIEARARKLYMAMTRAGQSLVLLTCERVAPEIARAFAATAPLPQASTPQT